MSTLMKVDKGEARTETEAGQRPACSTVSIATYDVRDGRGEGEDREVFLGFLLGGASNWDGEGWRFVRPGDEDRRPDICDPLFCVCNWSAGRRNLSMVGFF